MAGTLLLRAEGRDAQERLLRAGDGDAALLYAYLSLHPGATAEAAAAELRWDNARAERARGLLLAFGLAADGSLPPPRREADRPPEELGAARRDDPAFSDLCDFFEGMLGRVMRKSEMELLLNVYESLNLPCDVLILLVGWLREEGRLSARAFEKWAYQWHDQGLTSYESCVAFLDDYRQRNDRYGRIMRLFGYARRPSEAERAYMDGWLRRGITPELVSAGYDEMTTAIGRFHWAYLNKILLHWADEGIRTPEQARSRQRHPSPAQHGAPARPQSAEGRILQGMNERREARERVLAERLESLRAQTAFAENERQLRLTASRAARSRGEERAAADRERAVLLTKRAGLLRAAGKPEDWLDLRPDCPLCGDRGYVGTRKCECLLRALAAGEDRPAKP